MQRLSLELAAALPLRSTQDEDMSVALCPLPKPRHNRTQARKQSHIRAGVSQGCPPRGTRNFNRLLAEAAKTACMIREGEMLRRRLASQLPATNSSGSACPVSERSLNGLFEEANSETVSSSHGYTALDFKRVDDDQLLTKTSNNVREEVGRPRCPEPVRVRTTVMLRNIPNNYSRPMLLRLLDNEGFSAMYDFVYLPIDFKTQLSLGYAFVNLCVPSCVDAFWGNFDGFKKWAMPSRKVCTVSWSGPQQGLDANIQRYRNSPVMHESVPDACKPAIFLTGQRIEFPPPTKNIRAPRVRRCHFVSNVFFSLLAEDTQSNHEASRQRMCNQDEGAIISGDEACWL